jgi:nitroimidazol reductase NimA-like FMN-containing flavoprotein (pyridoxamine 5'-phosphate oxidase superfamily)
MIIYDLPAEACRELLGRTHLVRLACAQGNQPYIVPAFLYFEPGEDCLYGFAFHGQKIDWMRANPNVCVEVDEIVDQHHWTTVLVFGRYEEVGDSPEDYDARLRAAGLFQQQQSWWLPGAARVEGVTDQQKRVLYRIRINRMSGRRAGRTD